MYVYVCMLYLARHFRVILICSKSDAQFTSLLAIRGSSGCGQKLTHKYIFFTSHLIQRHQYTSQSNFTRGDKFHNFHTSPEDGLL